MTRHAIWLGDLVLATGRLQASPAVFDAVAELLGFGRVAAPQPVDAGVVPPVPPPSTPEPPTTTSASGEGADDIGRLPPLRPMTSTKPARASRPIELVVDPDARSPEPPSLLAPLASRYITQELVLSRRMTDEPDLEVLVDELARGRVPQPVPRLVRRTLARGVQVLVDTGEGMEPFATDQELFVELVTRVMGHSLVDVGRIFEVPDPDDPLDPWRWPAVGTPVLAITDLGAGGRAQRHRAQLVAEWRSVARGLAARQSELVVLTPYPVERYDADVSSVISFVQWDRSTTVASARGARRGVRS